MDAPSSSLLLLATPRRKHDRGLSPPAPLAAQLSTVFKRHGTIRQKRRASFLLARALEGFGPPPDDDGDDHDHDGENADQQAGGTDARPVAAGLGSVIRGMVESSTTRGMNEWDAREPPPADAAGSAADGAEKFADGEAGVEGAPAPLSAEASYQLLRQRMRDESLAASASPGVRSVEQACGGEEPEPQPEESPTATPPSHRDVLWRVTVLAEKGRAHAALTALQAVDGRKRGTRVAVPYKVYALLFRALSHGYSARSKEELELAAAPAGALEWLLRGMARQGYRPKTTILNFGLEAFAVAAQTRKVTGRVQYRYRT